MKLIYDVYEPEDSNQLNEVPVILLHGMFECRRTWTHTAPTIANATGRTVYAPDVRNHGESPWSDQMNLHNMAMDIVQLMEDLDIPKAAFVGHSMGGNIAMTLALQKPAIVDHLVLEDISMESILKKKKAILMVLHLLENSLAAILPDADETSAKEAVGAYLKKYSLEGPSNEAMFQDINAMPLKKVGSRFEWQTNMEVCAAHVRDYSMQQFTSVYYGKTLFMCGSLSLFDVKNDESISKLFPRCKRACFEGCGHFLHRDHPEKFLERVIKFIND